MNENEFLDWLTGAKFYIGYDRYARFGDHGFLIATKYNESDELEDLVDDLGGGDNMAIQAADKINDMNCWIVSDRDPRKAMNKIVDQLKEYYTNELSSE